MKITKYHDQEVKSTPHRIDVREMYNKESAQAMLMALKPGESLKTAQNSGRCIFLYC